MTVTDLPVDRLAILETKIDLLTERMSVLADDAERRARQRAMLDELTDDVSRISGDALALATRELESLTQTADLTDTVRLLRRLVEVAPDLERALSGLSQLMELVDDLAPLGGGMMSAATERLAEAERKGYVGFARAGVGVVDRIVTNFDEDDVEQLGDNVVAILEAVREITQPEMLALLGRMVGAVRAEQHHLAVEGDPPPGFLALARQLRDPDVRRGMGRAINTLKAVSTPPADAASTTPTDPDTKGAPQ